MFEYLKGILKTIHPTYVVVENQGIGYLVYMANPYRLTDSMDQEITLFIHQDVREDAILLYGFKQEEEKRLYQKLIQVSGIGPKSGLAIMANEDHSGFIQAIEEENNKYLMKFPGVGKKTASQLILDLKGKLNDIMPEAVPGSVEPAMTGVETGLTKGLDEALEALQALGYSQREVKKVLPQLKEMEETTTDTYLREALSLLMKR